jgi:hypothetical protein
MNEEKIKFSPEGFQKFYEEIVSKSLKLESEIFSKYGEAEIDLTHKFMDYTYKTLTIIGLIAGFGFAAISRVSNLQFFIVGEIFLFVAIIIGIYWIQHYYGEEIKSLQKASKEIKSIFYPRDKIALKILDSFNRGEAILKSDLKVFSNKDRELLNYFNKEKGSNKAASSKPITFTMILFAAGALLLLSSFVIPTSLMFSLFDNSLKILYSLIGVLSKK